jgi:hypothetical protein
MNPQAAQIEMILASLPSDQAEVMRQALAGVISPWQSRKARLDARDDAIRDVLTAFYASMAPTAAAKALARDLDHYLSTRWRHESELAELSEGASANRVALHRIARLAEGRSLAWRQIVSISDGDRGR